MSNQGDVSTLVELLKKPVKSPIISLSSLNKSDIDSEVNIIDGSIHKVKII